MKLIKFKLGIIALFVTLISVLITGCADQYEVAKKQGVVFSQDGTVLIKCNDTTISECVIPDGVIRIEYEAFQNCRYLKNVTIPGSIESITHGYDGRSRFWDCNNLQSVTIGNGVKEIGDSAFRNCSNLKSVTIPNSVTKIGDSAFKKCWSLQNITIPNSVTTIGEWAFQYCSNLKSVTIPKSVTTLGGGAFRDCDNLKEVRLPKEIKMEYVTFPDSCKVIRY